MIVRCAAVWGYSNVEPGANWYKLLADLFLLVAVFREARRLKPTIIYCFGYESTVIGWIVRILVKVDAKLYVDVQGSLTEELFRYNFSELNLLKRPLYWIEKCILKLGEVVFCSSENVLFFLKETLSFPMEGVVLLPDGINDVGIEMNSNRKFNIRNRLKLERGAKVLMYAGFVSKSKGVEPLLKLVPELLHRHQNLVVVLAGYGDLVNEYSLKHRKLISDGRLVFTGQVDYFKLNEILAAGDVFIDCKQKTTESSGKLFEYMKYGKPIICFATDFNKKLLRKSGIYINSFGELSQAISDLIREDFTCNIRNLTWERSMKSFWKVLGVD